MSRKGSAGQAAMKYDLARGPFNWGWGPGRKKDRRIERAIRKRAMRREIEEARDDDDA